MATIGVTLQTGSGQKPSVTNPAARVMQMKCDRRCGNRVSAVMCRRDTERREGLLITLSGCGRYSFRRPQHDSLLAQGTGL